VDERGTTMTEGHGMAAAERAATTLPDEHVDVL
jgi:hypothetical protein